LQHATEALLQSYGCTTYWREGVNEYGVGDLLYKRTIVFPNVPTPDVELGLSTFEDWIRDGVNAKTFGDVSEEEDILLFFLPPSTKLLSDDCTGRLGGHTSVETRDHKRVAYAYINACSEFTSVLELAWRTHAVTHELMEIASDPDPNTQPTWRTLG